MAIAQKLAPLHRLISKSDLATKAYALALGAVGRITTKRAISARALNTLAYSSVHWPEVPLPPRTVIVGRNTTFNLYPHFNEFDIEALVSRRLYYEPEVFAFLDDHISGYDCVLEIGANVGIFTLYFAQHVRQVYAFEPSTKAYFRLLQNLSANRAKNVTTFNCAVSDQTTFARLYEPEGHLTNGSLDPAFAGNFSADVRASTVLTVSGELLNDLASDASRILVKIDVEGAESLVLKSMAPFIASRCPTIIMEVLPDYTEELNSLAMFDNYSRFSLTSDGPVPRLKFQAERHRDYVLLPRSVDLT